MKLSKTSMLSVSCPGCGAIRGAGCYLKGATEGPSIHPEARRVVVEGYPYCPGRAEHARDVRRPTPAEWEGCGKNGHRTVAPDASPEAQGDG